MNHRKLIPILSAALALGACQTETEGENQGKLPASLRERLDRELHRVQLTEGPQLKSLLDGLAEFGPYATEPVKEKLLTSDTPRLRSNGVYVLSEIYRNDADEKALEAVRGALSDGDPSVRLEAARALLELHDRSGVRELVAALESDRRGVRVPAFLALRHATGSDYGYNPYDPADRRAEGVAKFREHFGIEERADAPKAISGSTHFAETPAEAPPEAPVDRAVKESGAEPNSAPVDPDLPTVPPAPGDEPEPTSQPAGDGGEDGGSDCGCGV